MNKKVEFKGSVVLNPVPVVLITSKNKEGKENVFTVGWAGTICTKPPMLSISIRPERLSYEYIKESMEFVVNMPSSSMVKSVDYCGVRSGRTNDKIKEMGFTMSDCSQINASYISDCPVSIECRVKQIIPLGTHDMFIADVLCSHINEELLDEKGKLHFEEGDLINYCHGEYYPMTKQSIGKFGYSVAKKAIPSTQTKNSNTNTTSSNIKTNTETKSADVRTSKPSKAKHEKTKTSIKNTSKKSNSSATSKKKSAPKRKRK